MIGKLFSWMFVGCWHDWGLWGVEHFSRLHRDSIQTKFCKKCGKQAWRSAT